MYERILSEFARGAREADKDPTLLPRLIELPVEFTDNAETAVEARKRYWAATFVPAMYNQNIYTPAAAELNGGVVGTDTIKSRTCISTDPEEHVRFARRYIDLGFDQLIFHSATPDQDAFLHAYGREVLPRLRAVTASTERQPRDTRRAA